MTDADLERLFDLDAGLGPALAIDGALADTIIDAALAGAGFGLGGGGGGNGGSGGANTSGSAAVGTKLAILGGAALVVVAIALFVGRGRPRGHEQAAATIADAGIIDSAGTGLGVAPPVERPLEPTAKPTIEPTTKPTSEPTDDVGIETDPSKPPKTTKPTHREPAADLLGEANAKRIAKQWREADVLYARVAEHAPRSLAAQTALIASASIHLEHFGDPKGAAQRLRRALALAPSGALAEEARWGLAEAARATHDAAAEAAALDDFLAHHASSPLAPRAKARRAELP